MDACRYSLDCSEPDVGLLFLSGGVVAGRPLYQSQLTIERDLLPTSLPDPDLMGLWSWWRAVLQTGAELDLEEDLADPNRHWLTLTQDGHGDSSQHSLRYSYTYRQLQVLQSQLRAWESTPPSGEDTSEESYS